jgi:hypothetical protein
MKHHGCVGIPRRAVATSLLAALGVALLASVGRPASGAASTSPSTMQPIPVMQTIQVKSLQDGHAITGSMAKLHRKSDRLKLRVETTELDPGERLHVFWAVFNNPAACVNGNPTTGAPCGPPDLFVDETAASLQLAANVAADASGHLDYRVSLAVGDTSGCIPGFPCNGVTNPLGAEVHSAMFDEAGGRQAAQFLPPSA